MYFYIKMTSTQGMYKKCITQDDENQIICNHIQESYGPFVYWLNQEDVMF